MLAVFFLEVEQADIMLNKQHFGVEADFQVVATDAAHVFGKDGADLVCFHKRGHPLPVGTIEVGTGVAVVNKELDIAETLVAGVLLQNSAL